MFTAAVSHHQRVPAGSVETLTPKDIGKLDDADMRQLAERMAEAYTDTVFWIDLKIIAGDILGEK